MSDTCPNCNRPVRLVLARSGDRFAIDPLPAPAGTVVLTADGITWRKRGPRGHGMDGWARLTETMGAVLAPWLLAELPAGRPRFALHDSTCPVPVTILRSRGDRSAQTAWATLRQRDEARERDRLAAATRRAKERPPINLADAVAALRVWEEHDLVNTGWRRVTEERKELAAAYGWTVAQLQEAIVLAEQARARGEVA
jgi:hypothetical protein